MTLLPACLGHWEARIPGLNCSFVIEPLVYPENGSICQRTGFQVTYKRLKTNDSLFHSSTLGLVVRLEEGFEGSARDNEMD
jgi:hypothetical protein